MIEPRSTALELADHRRPDAVLDLDSLLPIPEQCRPGGVRRHAHHAEPTGLRFGARDHGPQYADRYSNIFSESSRQVVGFRSAQQPLDRVRRALATGVTTNGAEYGCHDRKPTARYPDQADGCGHGCSAGLGQNHPTKAVDADVFERSEPISVPARNGDRIARGLQSEGEEGDAEIEKIRARLQRSLGDLVHLGMAQTR
jgi:hypothetical protein